ncbi:MAG TPA: ABC transporter permease [Microthrixaceae bacterium]|nr:ABC transporter permease [Microthrixaceae bacterium]
MRIALRELIRRPSRFVAAAVILTLIATLLMFIGGLLDGLVDSSTGAYRAQPGQLLAYSSTASRSLPRSRIPVNLEDRVSAVEGVRAVGGLATTQVAARRSSGPDSRDLIPTVLIGYDLAPRGAQPDLPGPGEVIADSTLRAKGVDVGDSLLLGPPRTPVKVVGFVDDSRYAGQISLWSSLDTWNSVTETIRPGAADPDLVQALVIKTSGSDESLIQRIESATDGQLEVLTIPQAIDSLPGVSTQRSTINQIIGVTVVIAIVVIALFFALITIERTALYGVLKAIGASSASLFVGVTAQAVAVTLVASAIATALAVLLAVTIPPGTLPYSLTAGRIAFSIGLLLFAAVLGCVFSLRRVLRIDPATAIGG